MLIMAHQVAGKAVRDGLFLSQFSAADLPKIMAAAAVFSIALGLVFARRMSRLGPARVVPVAFAIGGLLHWAEFGLLRSPGVVSRGIIVTTIYLHLVGLGAILLSGFWSIASEVFDPRAAKRHFGKITGAGTAGGILGGLAAERIAATMPVDWLLLVLGCVHLATWAILRGVPVSKPQPAVAGEREDLWGAARDAFRKAPFLANLAVLVLLGTVSAALLDYMFKSGAAAAYPKGQLTRYFAIFYTTTQVLTFLAQTFVTPLALRRLGLGRTMAGHPAAVGVGAVASMLLPAVVMGPAARGLEFIFRGSFLRSSYELFFTPAPPREKRATKTFIDVACDRTGDALGAGLLQMLLMFGPRQIAMPVLALTALLALASLWIARRMDAAYTRALEHGLLSRAVTLDDGDSGDSMNLSVILRPTTVFPNRKPAPPAVTVPPPAVPAQDPVLARIADLRSGSSTRVRAALAPDQPFDTAIMPFAIRLLAWDPALEWSRAFLLRHAHQAVGQLTDALLDTEQDFAVRRRIPQILAYTSSQRAVDGLTEALRDPRFEIRFHCSRAIEFLHRMTDNLRFDREALAAAVESELSSSRAIWDGRKLLDRDGSDSQYWYLDEVVRERADKSLEHLFSLLAVMLPAEPLKAAFRGLHGEDRMLRGLALEFLEMHLSQEQVARLRSLVDPSPSAKTASAGAPLTIG
jgi:AAA family ATP:ADP antiporter